MNLRPLLALISALFAGGSAPGLAADQDWHYEMGWRYVKYQDRRGPLVFSIGPMVSGPDVVYVPDSSTWDNNAPTWAKGSQKEILARLKSVQWHRNLRWVEAETGQLLTDQLPIPGSLESTTGGKTLELYRLFHPTSKVTHDQAHEVWHTAARRFAEATTGRVTVVADRTDPNSVFGAIELPALRSNPNVTLEWR